MADFVVKKAPHLSKEGEMRYIVADIHTGEIVDDAQGYGYKTPDKAINAFKYKLNNPCFIEAKKRDKAIKAWLVANPTIGDNLTDIAIHIYKGQGPDDRLTARIVKNLLDEMGLQTDFQANDILRVWRTL